MEKGDYENNFPKSKQEWLPEVERQDNELFNWIDEFLESEEYAEILRNRIDLQSKSELKSLKTKSGQTVPPKPLEPKTRTKFKVDKRGQNDKTKERVDFKQHTLALLQDKVQESLIKLKIKNTVKNQRRGIEIIRNKILEAKCEHDENVLNEREKMFDTKTNIVKTLKKLHILVRNEDLTDKVVEKVVNMKNRRREKQMARKQNTVKIVANILKDMKRIQMEKNMKNKLGVKMKLRKKINVEDDETVYEEDIVTEDDFVEEEESEVPVIEETISKKQVIIKTSKKDKLNVKLESKSQKLSKTQSVVPSSVISVKSSKQKSIIEENVIPPVIPNPNPRKKVVPEFVMTEVLENITKLYNYLKEKEGYEIEAGLAQDVHLPFDEGFFCRPNKLIFKDFKPGKRYTKIISIVNGNNSAKKIFLDRIVWNADIEEELLLEVEAMGVRRVSPGMSFKVCLRFTPEVLNKTADGKIIFVTSKLRTNQLEQFVLKVVCVPLCAAVLVSPTVVSFEEMPIWRAQAMMKQGKNFKIVTITNSGLKECKVVVTKIFNNQTMEQEWKKIISIIRIDDSADGERKQLSSSTLEDPTTADPFPRNLVQQCVENVFNVFKFERNVFIVPPKTTMEIKCWLRDVSEAGYQVESYNFSIYERFFDGQLYCIGTQDVIVNSETTSHFLTSSVEIIDFEVCVYGSVYQLDFELTNPCKLAHHIQICFAKRMKSYLQAHPGVTTILPNQTTKICIKFLPQQGILHDNKFYDSDVCLLEFPVNVAVQTRGYEDTPQLRIDVFAAVTEAHGVIMEFMHCEQYESSYDNGLEYYNLGSCTTIESVYMDLVVNNVSLVPQQFGFLNLPKYATITPNFGFGKLKPMQKVTVRLILSPSREDIIETGGLLKFELVLSTIKQCGALKQKPHDNDLAKKLKQMEDSVCKFGGSNSSKLKQDIQAIKQAVKQKSVSVSASSPSKSLASVNRFVQAVEDDEQFLNLVKYDIEEEKEVSSNMEVASFVSQITNTFKNSINFKLNVVDVAVELSYSMLNFPNTPAGSFSSVTIDIITHKMVGFKYYANFKITSNNDQFEVQPSIGRLLSNKKRALWVVAKPRVPDAVVRERVLTLKRMEREKLEQQLKEDSDNSDNTVKDGKGDGKGDKKQNKGGRKKQKYKNLIDDNVIELDDLYQAEMNVWRTTDPYFIEALFTCRIDYTGVNTSLKRPYEEIFFKAVCQVVVPNFVHDQKYQVIDFGNVAVGTSVVKDINFQNIQRENIMIDASPLNPVGPFSSSANPRSEVPPEYLCKYPIKFTPTEDQSIIEYLDFTSETTYYPFIIRGVGIKPNLTFNPNFTICRISAAKGNYQDCAFEIKNESNVELTLYIEQICELEGTLNEAPLPVINDDNKKAINKPSKPTKKSKFSTELYDDEIYSLNTSFLSRDPTLNTLFHVLDNTGIDNTYHIEARGKCNVRIRFGEVPIPAVSKSDSKKSDNKSMSTKSRVGGTIKSSNPLEGGGEYFIAKYNLYLGVNYIKDIIIISNIT